jgi:hypothetical protein
MTTDRRLAQEAKALVTSGRPGGPAIRRRRAPDARRRRGRRPGSEGCGDDRRAAVHHLHGAMLSFAISESAASSRGSPTAPPSVSGDTQVAAPLAFVRCRARARRVITRRTPAKPESIRTGDALAVASIRFVGAISSPSGRHDGYSRGCRNQNSSFRELMAKSRLSPVDETADDWGSRYVSCLLRSQYVASARCRATAPMALGWPLRRAMRS